MSESPLHKMSKLDLFFLLQPVIFPTLRSLTPIFKMSYFLAGIQVQKCILQSTKWLLAPMEHILLKPLTHNPETKDIQ